MRHAAVNSGVASPSFFEREIRMKIANYEEDQQEFSRGDMVWDKIHKKMFRFSRNVQGRIFLMQSDEVELPIARKSCEVRKPGKLWS